MDGLTAPGRQGVQLDTAAGWTAGSDHATVRIVGSDPTAVRRVHFGR